MALGISENCEEESESATGLTGNMFGETSVFWHCTQSLPHVRLGMVCLSGGQSQLNLVNIAKLNRYKVSPQ